MSTRKNRMGSRKSTSAKISRIPKTISTRRSSATDIDERVLTGPYGVISSTAGGIIAPTAVSSGFVFTNGTEFASYAARYSEYRIRAMRMYFMACHPTNVPTATTTADHGAIFVGQSEQGPVVGSGQQVMSLFRRRVISTSKSFIAHADWSRNPNAQLWNAVGAIVVAANNFSIQWGTPAFANNAIVASTDYYSCFLEWDVQFRGQQ
jgi:hypothetical protein